MPKGPHRTSTGACRLADAIWRGYAPAVGGIIIVAVLATDRGSSAVIAGGIGTRGAVVAGGISTCGSSANRGSINSGSTDADSHARAYTTVVATSVNAAAIDTNAICGGVS